MHYRSKRAKRAGPRTRVMRAPGPYRSALLLLGLIGLLGTALLLLA